MKDEIFKKPIEKQFEFDASVASVFDDMISRSVPYYDICVDLITECLSKILPENANVYDLGSSTGNTLLKLFSKRKDLKLFGVDNSSAMIENATTKSKAYGADINFFLSDILKFDFSNSDCVILNYTLQFIRPIYRADFLKQIFNSLNKNGIFIFSEKLVYDDKKFNKNMIEIYQNYKKNQGYSEFEIAQKREALENVLIPYTQKENIKLCNDAGFKNVETIFKWGNFATFLAFK